MTAFETVRARLVDVVGDGAASEQVTGEADRRSSDQGCRCRTTVGTPPGTGVEADEELRVDAGDCPGAGTLSSSPACRARIIRALAGRDVARIRVRRAGIERVYDGDALAVLIAAGRFAERADRHDPELAARARHDPLATGRIADGRAGPIARVAAETGLGEANRYPGYENAFQPAVGLSMSNAVLDSTPPSAAERVDRRELSTGATVTRYRGESGPPTYHPRPLELGFAEAESAALGAAYRRLGGGSAAGEGLFAGRGAGDDIVDGGKATDRRSRPTTGRWTSGKRSKPSQ